MMRGYLPKRILLCSALAVCIALATSTVLRRWMIDHISSALNIPVAMGSVKIYPRSATLHVTDLTLGDERSAAYLKIPQSWLTWKEDCWSAGAFRFRRAIFDDVQVEADLTSHDYFGVFAQLQAQRSGELLPSIYGGEVRRGTPPELYEPIRTTETTLSNFRSTWNQAKEELQKASEALQLVLLKIEKSDSLSPNSLRERQQLEIAMEQALAARQQYLQAKYRTFSFAERVLQMESELEQQQRQQLERLQSDLHLDEMIIKDLSERILKEHCLAQTSIWLDYIATGKSLLGAMQLPQLISTDGTEFHFAKTSPEPRTVIDELTLKGALSLHHRPHEIFLRGFNLRSLSESKTVTQIGSSQKMLEELKPTVLRGEIKSLGQVLLFDFRRLWKNQFHTPDVRSGFPSIYTSHSDVITLESPSVGPAAGELKLSPSVGLAWQGKPSWVWSQWRFDEEDKWRAKWVIRQEDLHFSAQVLSEDEISVNVANAISDHVRELGRIDVEMDITCIKDQYAIALTSNLDSWLPDILKMAYRAEEQAQMEKVRTAIQTRQEKELTSLRQELQTAREKLNQQGEPELARLEKLSTDLASKLGTSPRLMLSQEAENNLKR